MDLALEIPNRFQGPQQAIHVGRFDGSRGCNRHGYASDINRICLESIFELDCNIGQEVCQLTKLNSPSTTATSASVNPYSSYTSASAFGVPIRRFDLTLQQRLDMGHLLGGHPLVQIEHVLHQVDHAVVACDVGVGWCSRWEVAQSAVCHDWDWIAGGG